MEITSIGGAVVLALLIIGVFCYYKFCVPKSADKDKAMEFINGYVTVFENIVRKIIDTIDITQYKTVEEFESDIFAIAYDECWDYTEKALQEAMSNSSIGALVAKCITKETVEECVRKLIEKGFLMKMQDVYVARINQVSQEVVEEDARLQKEADAYETGEKEVEPYEEPPVEPPKTPINPQTDEEGAYDENDPSQEIVGEAEEHVSMDDISEELAKDDDED